MLRAFTFVLTLFLTLILFFPSMSLAVNRAGAVTVSSMIGTYNFDNDQIWRDAEIYSLGFGYNFTEHWQLELGLAATEDVYTRAAGPDGPSSDMYFFKTDVNYHLNPADPLVFYLSAGIGQWSVNPSNATAFSEEFANYGGGIKVALLPDLPLRLDIKQVVFGGEWIKDERNVTYSLGINSQFGGVAPQPVSVDADNDGIIDSLDQCLETPAGATVDPYGCLLDSDSDGVVDMTDHCPATPSGTIVDAAGCPLDSDMDGVSDLDDDCPGTTSGSVVDARGCVTTSAAEIESAAVVETAIVAPAVAPPVIPVVAPPTTVRFSSGSKEVLARDRDSLAAIAEQLINDPTKNMRIEGYTDSVGSTKVNKRLSQERAENIRLQLIKKYNIAPERIRAIGHGEINPIADNATQFGRRINRRVEITIE